MLDAHDFARAAPAPGPSASSDWFTDAPAPPAAPAWARGPSLLETTLYQPLEPPKPVAATGPNDEDDDRPKKRSSFTGLFTAFVFGGLVALAALRFGLGGRAAYEQDVKRVTAWTARTESAIARWLGDEPADSKTHAPGTDPSAGPSSSSTSSAPSSSSSPSRLSANDDAATSNGAAPGGGPGTDAGSDVASPGVGIPPDTGVVRTDGAPAGHRIFVDERTVGQTPDAVTVKCGVRWVKLGSSGRPRAVDVPCGGEVSVVAP